jgi:hypothetical protein
VTSSPAPANGPPDILQAVFFPNPVTGPILRLRVNLAGPADKIRLKVYSSALVASLMLEANGSFQPGWNDVQLDGNGLAGGAWFCVIHASSGGTQSAKLKPLKLYKIPR